ncbi:hypothetical protein TUM16664_48740 [Enterobacter cloacae]|jgi:hypothetical protein|nr:hypothetical protein TUM16664_48740 [Enterobacter cloacae]
MVQAMAAFEKPNALGIATKLVDRVYTKLLLVIWFAVRGVAQLV